MLEKKIEKKGENIMVLLVCSSAGAPTILLYMTSMIFPTSSDDKCKLTKCLFRTCINTYWAITGMFDI